MKISFRYAAMVVLSFALFSLAAQPALAQLWWERGADSWYYKDDWKGLALTGGRGGNQRPSFTKAIAVPGGAVSGWIVVWGDRGYSLVVNGKEVGSGVDGGLIDDYDLTAFLGAGDEVKLRIDGAKVCAEGEIVARDGKRYPFMTGKDWQVGNGGAPATEPMVVQASGDAYSRAHDGRLMSYNDEERGKSAIAKSLARIQKLEDQSIYLMRRFRPADQIVSFDENLPWRRAERTAAPLLERARSIITTRAIAAQKASKFADAIGAANEAGDLISAAEAPVLAATAIYTAQRQFTHLENVSALLGKEAPSVAADLAELRTLLQSAAEAHAQLDWPSAMKATARVDEKAREIRGRIEAAAAKAPAALVRGIGMLDASPEDRFGWFNARDLMGNDPVNWPFVIAPPSGGYIDLSGHWDFKTDPDNVGESQGWMAGPVEGWKKLFAPQAWEYQGILDENLKGSRALFNSDTTGADKPYNGFGWYRKSVLLPADWQGKKVSIIPGDVYNWCRIFINGKPIHDGYKRPGRIGPFKRFRLDPPHIEIPADVLKPGQPNTIAIQVYNHDRFGGIAIGPVGIYVDGAAPKTVETAGPMSFAYEHGYPAAGGRTQRYTFLASAMSPAVVVATDGNVLDLWGWEAKGYGPPQTVEFNTTNGFKSEPLGVGFAMLAGGNWMPADTWLMVRGPGGSTLVVPATRPQSLTWHRASSGYMTLSIEFVGTATAAVLQFPAGADLSQETCRNWARILRHYPVSSSQLTRTTDKPGVLAQAVRYNYVDLSIPNERAAAPAAPLPMLASYAIDYKHPNVSAANAKATEYRSGMYGAVYRLAVEADTIQYETPAADRSKMLKGVGELFARNNVANNVHGGLSERGLFQRMADWGMDHCRYALAFAADWDLQIVQRMGGPVLDDEARWKRLDELVKNCNDAGVQMMLCSFTEIRSRNWLANPQQEKNVFEMWRRIAKRYASLPQWAISYDFFNEPAYMNRDHWNRIMKELTAIMRSEDKTHTLVWEAADGWAQPFWCMWMEPVKDDNVIYSFHHYGKHWGYAYDEYYPGYKSTFEWTQADPYLEAILWSIKHNVTIHCGEFGISMIQPGHDGETWLDDHLGMFERFGIGWNWWNYSGEDIYRTGLAAGNRISPFVPIMAKWAAKSGWGAERRAKGEMPPIDLEAAMKRE